MQNIRSHLVQWSLRALAWFTRAWLPMVTAFLVILALITSLYYCQTESSVRLWGLLLQIFGIAAAAIGIRDTRRMFGKPSFLEQLRTWLTSIPRLKPPTVSASGSGKLSMSCSAKAHAWKSAGEPTVESRLSAAEANLKELNERANVAESAFEAHVRAATQNLREEADLRKEADRQLHLRIEAASTDGLHLAMVGVVWLACGVIMSTAPNELLGLVR